MRKGHSNKILMGMGTYIVENNQEMPQKKKIRTGTTIWNQDELKCWKHIQGKLNGSVEVISAFSHLLQCYLNGQNVDSIEAFIDRWMDIVRCRKMNIIQF